MLRPLLVLLAAFALSACNLSVPQVTPTVAPSNTPTSAPAQTETPRPSLTPTATPSPTANPTETPTDTLTPSQTYTAQPTQAATQPQPASFTPAPTGSPTNTLIPPTQDVTPTLITATPFTTPQTMLATVTLLPTEPNATQTPQPSLTPFPTLQPIDPAVRAFVLGTANTGELIRGGVPLIPDAALFERNPQNPAQYAVTDSSGQLYFTGLNGENTHRVTESPFSEFIAFSREENNAYISDIAWSADGQYLAFLVNGDKLGVDGIWFFAPGQFAPVQLLVDCPTPQHPGCQIVTSPAGPDLWESLSLDWASTHNDYLLVRTWIPSKNRAGLTVLPISQNEQIRNARPPVFEYDYGSWSQDGTRILVSGYAPDGNVYIGWITPDGTFNELVLAAEDAGLWVQDAVQRPDGSIVTLGAPLAEGGPSAPARLYTGSGTALTGPIGNTPPERVVWSPDRSAVMIATAEQVFLADTLGNITNITAEVGTTQAINWVDGSIPVTDGQLMSSTEAPSIAPVGVRDFERQDSGYTVGSVLQVLAPAGLWVRAEPSTTADTLASVLAEETITVADAGAVQQDGILWLEVIAPDGTRGWVAIDINGEQTISP